MREMFVSFGLMLRCWEESPRERPTMRDVTQRIASFLEEQNARTQARNKTQQVPSSRWKGRANYAVRALLATVMNVPISKVAILRGETSRDKRVRIDAAHRVE